ncbi:LamG domain-containing protein, partial [Rathayibacter sp. AY1A3]|uniref:LamG domain-containing protein n=1 Tax=Rathayibacter sp. AY1A3 TaxID=2080521 RepID=UPI000D4AB8B8
MRRFRRTALLSGAVCGLLLASGLVASGGAASAATLPAPAAHYPLSTDLVDTAGDYDGRAVGAVTWADGLTLPGGSGTGPHASLPAAVVTDQGEDLTVSTWVKREVPNGNYSALFFGTAANPDVPTNYWLLNPSNPSGTAKSVFTDGASATQPWSTEVGPSSAVTSVPAAPRSQWAQYTTVITADSIRGYLDGVAMGPAVPKTTRIA